jgi:hypothetical protein
MKLFAHRTLAHLADFLESRGFLRAAAVCDWLIDKLTEM